MKKVKLLFTSTHKYNGRVFEAGKVYEIQEERPGFIDRWIKRGCVEPKEDSKIQEAPKEVEEKPVQVDASKRRGRKSVEKPAEQAENDVEAEKSKQE